MEFYPVSWYHNKGGAHEKHYTIGFLIDNQEYKICLERIQNHIFISIAMTRKEYYHITREIKKGEIEWWPGDGKDPYNFKLSPTKEAMQICDRLVRLRMLF